MATQERRAAAQPAAGRPGGRTAEEAIELWLNRLTRRTPLDAEERRALYDLHAGGRISQVNRDFVRVGDKVTMSCLIVDGLAARFAQLRNGQRSSVALHIPGDMVDLHSLIVPRVSWAIRALTPTTILRVPHEAIRAFIERYPRVGIACWADCVADGNMIAQRTVNIARKEAAARVAHLFCEMALRYRAVGLIDENRFPFPITQGDLGDALGLTSVHVNRVLMRLKDDGIATKSGGCVTIHDYPRLRDLAEFDWRYLDWSDPPPPEAD